MSTSTDVRAARLRAQLREATLGVRDAELVATNFYAPLHLPMTTTAAAATDSASGRPTPARAGRALVPAHVRQCTAPAASVCERNARPSVLAREHAFACTHVRARTRW